MKNCWLNSTGENSCYKSTMMFPICFGGPEYSEEFRAMWGERMGDGVMKLVYAYLCIDSVYVHYFRADARILMQTFSDLIALLFFERERWRVKARTMSLARTIDIIYSRLLEI